MTRVLYTIVTAGTIAMAAACGRVKTSPPVGKQTPADSADQVMFGTRFTLTEKGVYRADLVADTAFFYDDNTRVELRPVHTVFYTATGVKNAVLTARQGTYLTQNGTMTARGTVDVVSEDGRRLQSPELRYDQTRNEIASDSAFVLTEPTRRLEGIGFRSDPNMQNVRVLKVLSGTGGPVAVPKQ
jgi:LPS export ABC transporter protein LptC